MPALRRAHVSRRGQNSGDAPFANVRVRQMIEERSFQRLSQRIEGLIAGIEAAPDQNLRTDALNLTRSLMELHGAGLDRLMEIVARAGASGYALMDDFAGDRLVAGLHLLYGLHPYDLETRVM